MSDVRAGNKPVGVGFGRSIKLAPMTRAVRSALAASTFALAVTAAGNTFAAPCALPLEAENRLVCDQAAIDIAPVVDLTVVDGGWPASTGLAAMPFAIEVSAPGDVAIDNADPIEEIDAYYSVAAINGYSPDGNVDITNQEDGDLVVASGWGNAIGIYGQAPAGDVTVDNDGGIVAASYYGIADGIFAAGINVDVTNSGSIETYSYGWTAGIEAESTDSTVVVNSGDISAVASQPYLSYDGFSYYLGAAAGGHATGILATGGEGGVEVSNSGSIYASGGYVTGVDVLAVGDITIDNSGSIATGPAPSRVVDYSTNIYGIVTVYGAQLASGIEATSLGDGTAITITNSGDIHAISRYGSSGISATAGGYGSTVSVANTGDIYAGQYVKYGYGAYGIVASADADATVTNSGAIEIYSGGAATGAAALSFAGSASVTNSGDMQVVGMALGNYTAAGLLSFAGNGAAHAENSGNLQVEAFGYIARGIDAQGYSGVTVVNSGSLQVDAKYGYGVYAVAMGGDASVVNTADGEIGFTSTGNGSGIFGVSVGADLYVHNAGVIQGQAVGQAMGVFGLSQSGDVNLVNSGSIDVATSADSALGLFARAHYGTAHVTNSGDITVSTFESSEYIDNLGYLTYGVLAQGLDVDIANTGNITVQGEAYASGIVATGVEDVVVASSGGDIEVYSPGTLVVYSYYVPPGGGGGYYGGDGGGHYASLARPDLVAQRDRIVQHAGDDAVAFDGGYGGDYGSWYYYTVLMGSVAGITALSTAGDVSIANGSDITAASHLVDTVGIKARALGDATVTNSGDILASTTYGYADGILVMEFYSYADGQLPAAGDLTVVNSGDIGVIAPAPGAGKASGITATRTHGNIDIQNSGNIDIEAGGRSYGVYAHTKYGDARIVNSGDITMTSHYDAQIGLQVDTGHVYGGGDATVINTGNISVHSDYGLAVAIGGVAGGLQEAWYTGIVPHGDVYGFNSGDLQAYSPFFAAGFQIRATDGDATLVNTGDVHVATGAVFDYYDPGEAVGINAITFLGGDVAIHNTGNVTVEGYTDAFGVYGDGFDGSMTIDNGGDITVGSVVTIARGINAKQYYGDITINNLGDVHASGEIAGIGIHTSLLDGAAVVNNGGDVHASSASYAIGVFLQGVYGTSTLNNSGSITVDGADGLSWAVLGSYAQETINNRGLIDGAVVLYDGDDALVNGAGGRWTVSNGDTDFGVGNDSIENLAGGTIELRDGAIHLGGGDNTFTNAGTILASGNSLIDMGGQAPSGATGLAMQAGLFQPAASSLPISIAAALNASPLVNNGTISLDNGFTGDVLTIAGDLAGTGSIGIDANLLDGTSDLLHVEGDVATGAVQTVNIAFTGLPSLGATPVDFAQIDGTAAAGSFVGGQATGFSPSDFLDLDVVISHQAGAGGGSVFAAGIGVAGLNSTGALAANLASGAAGFINSQIGTFRQRLGVNPYGNDGKLLSAFFRAYRDEGDVSPTHAASNFGQGGSFDFNQSSSGQEVGINANVFGHLHAGIVLGTADSRQRLIGTGVGEARMDGMTVGGYATWYTPNGFYVDLAGRQMAADVRLKSADTTMESRVEMSAASLEAGYQWMVGERVSLVPQLQYTRTEVEDMRALSGEHVDFVAHGGSYSRGRLGIEASMAFQAGAAKVTPYGSINAIRTFDGESSYTVAGQFTGTTTITGTSAMVELGVGVQKGAFGFGLGTNWTDGGALDGFVGGQANVRYAW